MKTWSFTSLKKNTSSEEFLRMVKKICPNDAPLLYSGTEHGKWSFAPMDEKENTVFSDFDSAQQYLFQLNKQWDKKQYEYDFSTKKNNSAPFLGGVFLSLSYDYGVGLQKIEQPKNIDFPFLIVRECEKALYYDHQNKEVFLGEWSDEKTNDQLLMMNDGGKNETLKSNIIRHSEQNDSGDPESMELRCCSDDLLDPRYSPSTSLQENPGMTSGVFNSVISKEQYLKNFNICQSEIEKGNSFQINYSQEFKARTSKTSWEVFINATKKNPAPFMVHWQFEKNNSIISCSPERLFALDHNRRLFAQPIKGTRPRGKDQIEDERLAEELKNSKKENAENIMIVDLLRNDFGKVCEYGSVKVPEYARVEKYQTVMHLVSDVEGVLHKTKNVFDVIDSLFPGGSITGAPKHETMKIIARLEKQQRGIYCGSMGYINFDGSADFNICIRTMWQKDGEISTRAGGGIIYGADCEREYEESLAKIEGVRRSVGERLKE